MNHDKCFDGWAEDDGNTQGRCCCNCRYQRKIVGHPWNTNPAHKKPVTEMIGWGCEGVEQGIVIFFDRKHSACELHEWKESVVEEQHGDS